MTRSFRFIIFIGLALASPVASGLAAGAFNIKVLPREFVQIVERSPGILNVIGLEYRKKILGMSSAVDNEGLTGVSEKIYLPLGTQRQVGDPRPQTDGPGTGRSGAVRGMKFRVDLTLALKSNFWPNEDGNFVGGMFWDGRATGETLGDPLAEQALGPFMNPLEQNMPDKKTIILAVRRSDYADLFEKVWGPAPSTPTRTLTGPTSGSAAPSPLMKDRPRSIRSTRSSTISGGRPRPRGSKSNPSTNPTPGALKIWDWRTPSSGVSSFSTPKACARTVMS